MLCSAGDSHEKCKDSEVMKLGVGAAVWSSELKLMPGGKGQKSG